MKLRFLQQRAVWLVIGGISLIILLGLWSGAGYVLIVWLGWQVQTSATLLMLLLFTLILLLVWIIRSTNRWIKHWHLRHPKTVTHYQQLLPFEQLGCLWLLNAKTSKQSDIETIFNQSASLRQLVKAHLQRENAQLEQAGQALNQGSALTDLLVLEQIELYLAKQHYDQAYTILMALKEQPTSSFVQSLNPAWDDYVQGLWARLLLAQPWLFLSMETQPVLTPAQYYNWLITLQQQLNHASPEQVQQLLGYAEHAQTQPEFWQDVTNARQWLLVLDQLQETNLTEQQKHNLLQQRQQLADQLLRLEFDPRVLNIWLHTQLQHGNMQCPHLAQRLNDLAQRYPAQPAIALAQWHQLNAGQHTAAAQEILQNWPQHADFAYLRLHQALVSQPELQADLERLYQARGSLDN